MQDVYPGLQVGGAAFDQFFHDDAAMGAQEAGGHFRHEFFPAVLFIAKF
jgi:hypothetical protein